MNSEKNEARAGRQEDVLSKIVKLVRQPWFPCAPACITAKGVSPGDEKGKVEGQNPILVKIDEAVFDALAQSPGQLSVETRETTAGESIGVVSLGHGAVLLPAEEITTCILGFDVQEIIIFFVSESRYMSIRYRCEEFIRDLLGTEVMKARCDEQRKRGSSIEEIVLRDSYADGMVRGVFAVDLDLLDVAPHPLQRVFSRGFRSFPKACLVDSVVEVLRDWRTSGIEPDSSVIASAMEVVYDTHFSRQPVKLVSTGFWRDIRCADVLDALRAFDNEFVRKIELQGELGKLQTEIAAHLVRNRFAERCVELLALYPQTRVLWAASTDEVLTVVVQSISGQPDEALLKQVLTQYGTSIVVRVTEMQRRLALMEKCNESEIRPKSFASWYS